MKTPVRVAVTGAAGQISYSLLFRIASGQMLGADQPVILQLLEITPAMKALEGVVMEIDDCAFPLVTDFVLTDDIGTAFEEVNYALLVGARPRLCIHIEPIEELLNPNNLMDYLSLQYFKRDFDP